MSINSGVYDFNYPLEIPRYEDFDENATYVHALAIFSLNMKDDLKARIKIREEKINSLKGKIFEIKAQLEEKDKHNFKSLFIYPILNSVKCLIDAIIAFAKRCFDYIRDKVYCF